MHLHNPGQLDPNRVASSSTTGHPEHKFFIDAHVHLYPSKRLGGLIRWMHGFFPDHPVPIDSTLDDVLSDLRKHNYGSFVALAFSLEPEESRQLNEFMAKMAENNPGMAPFGCVHRDDDSPSVVVEYAIRELRLAGLKFHPMVQRFDPWDKKLFGVYERMNEWRRPIYIHTGFDDWYGFHLPESSFRSLLRTYPDIPFVFSHMIFPKLGLAFDLVEEFPNLYLDATNVPGTIMLFRRTGTPVPELDMDEACEGMERWADRIMFGTDHPAGMGSIERILSDFHDLGLGPEAESKILSGTASRFLQEHCPEYFTPPAQ